MTNCQYRHSDLLTASLWPTVNIVTLTYWQRPCDQPSISSLWHLLTSSLWPTVNIVTLTYWHRLCDQPSISSLWPTDIVLVTNRQYRHSNLLTTSSLWPAINFTVTNGSLLSFPGPLHNPAVNYMSVPAARPLLQCSHPEWSGGSEHRYSTVTPNDQVTLYTVMVQSPQMIWWFWTPLQYSHPEWSGGCLRRYSTVTPNDQAALNTLLQYSHPEWSGGSEHTVTVQSPQMIRRLWTHCYSTVTPNDQAALNTVTIQSPQIIRRLSIPLQYSHPKWSVSEWQWVLG